MPIYKHTQVATVILVSLALTILAISVIGVFLPHDAAIVAVIASTNAVLFLTMVVMPSLGTQVTRQELTVSFGMGLIRKRIPVADISSAKPVTNRWYHGWGIHRVDGGWLYNVSGFEAVQLEFAGGGHFRVGTDDPNGLIEALRLVVPATAPAKL